MSDLIIVGASGLGKEVAWLANRACIPVAGFLDDDLSIKGEDFYGKPILGGIDEWFNYEDSKFVIAIASPSVRECVLDRMLKFGSPDFITLIDPSVQIDFDNVEIGCGTVICAGTVCTADVKVGGHCIINKLCSIGHDVVIGNFVSMSPQVMLGGHAVIKHGVELGASSLIRQGLKIAEGAVVGMGAVVTKDVAPNTVVVGNPAKILERK